MVGGPLGDELSFGVLCSIYIKRGVVGVWVLGKGKCHSVTTGPL